MASFGAQLKQEREKRGVSLEEISQSTKIGTRMLHALEEEKLDQLPGGIFNKGFIRAYARFLGMDEDQIIADYMAASGAAQPEKKSDGAAVVEARYLEEEEGRSLPWGAIAVVLLIVALAFAIWGFYSRQHNNGIKRPATHASAELPASAAPAQAIPSVVSAIPSPLPPASTTTNSPAQAANEILGSGAGAILIKVKAQEDSWISITADGRKVLAGTLSAPAERTVRAAREVVIKAGNAGALDLEFNGKKLPNQGDYDEVKTLTFDARGLRPTPPAPAATQTTQSAPQP